METKNVTLFETALSSWFLQGELKYGMFSTEKEAREFAEDKNLTIIDVKHPKHYSYSN